MGSSKEISTLSKPGKATPKPMLSLLPRQGRAPETKVTKETLMERNRRGKMNDFYNELNSMVPNLFPKATREKIIDETVGYIRRLEEHIKELEARKEKARLHSAVTLQRQHTSSLVHVTVSGYMMFFGIQSKARQGLPTHILEVFERCNAEVLSTTVSRRDDDGGGGGGGMVMLNVTAVIKGGDQLGISPELVIQRIKTDLLKYLS